MLPDRDVGEWTVGSLALDPQPPADPPPPLPESLEGEPQGHATGTQSEVEASPLVSHAPPAPPLHASAELSGAASHSQNQIQSQSQSHLLMSPTRKRLSKARPRRRQKSDGGEGDDQSGGVDYGQIIDGGEGVMHGETHRMQPMVDGGGSSMYIRSGSGTKTRMVSRSLSGAGALLDQLADLGESTSGQPDPQAKWAIFNI